MTYNFNEEMQQAEKKYDMGRDDRFKFEEGENRIRVLSPGKPVATHRLGGNRFATCYGMDEGCPYHGEGAPKDKDGNEQKPSVKFVMWVIDRRDSKVKLAFMPYTIVKALGALQNSEDYAFDDIPMPYDIAVSAQNAGKKEVNYTILPSPKLVPLTPQEEEELGKKRPVEDVVERMKNKAQKADKEEVEDDDE